ncbi:MAG: kinase-like domain-containing protein [Benjaminiella poitrasii]|nr:MAG: kinase-like domain-containing protein [Benjaminiella poitrasii]
MQTVTYNSGDEREEQEKVVENIESLMANVTCLENYYKLVDRIGFGTFSTVYLAEDIRHNLYNNDEWRIPLIRSEHLNDIRPGEESSNESEDYQHLLENDHDDWSEFVALKHIYSTSSPNRIAKEVQIMKILKGTLCVSPLITAFRERENIFMVMPYINHDDFKDIFPEMTVNDIKHYMKCLLTALKGVHSFGIIHRDVKPNNFLYNYRKKVGYLVDFAVASSSSSATAAVSTTSRDQKPSGSRPSTSQAEPAKVAGRVNNDPRLPIRANRAGTRGFRAPEVLLRVPRQTCAIDVWSAGVILLCFLTSRYPFFMAGDESDGLIELCQVFGLKDMETCAKINHRGLHLKLDKPCKRIPWIDLIKQLNDHSLEEWSKDDLYLGIDLLDRLLKLDPYTRISAEDALTHPFFDIM